MRYIIAPLLLVSACGLKADKGSDLLNIEGESTVLAGIMGSGIDTVKYQVVGNCVDLGALVTQSGNQTGNGVKYRLLEINSQQSLRESLNFSAQASFKTFGGGGGGKVDFAKSLSTNKNTKYLLIHVEVSNQIERAKTYTFTDEVQKGIRSGQLTKENFVTSCGNEFVYGRKTGGEFFALFEYEFANSEEEMKFSAAIKYSAGAWKGNAELNNELSKFDMTARTSLRMYKLGGPAGNLPKIENLKDFAQNFDSLVSTGNSPVTLELLTKSYDGVSPFTLKPNPAVLGTQERMINEMAKVRDNAKDILGDIYYVKRRAKEFNIDPNIHKLSEWEKNAQDVISTVENAAKSCMDEPFSNCKIPNTSLPTFIMPDRKIVSVKDMKCAAARYYEFANNRISEQEFREYEAKNFAPKYVEPATPSLGVEGWAKCNLVAPYL